jgi:fructose/tagatose bisphosphate aldolase
LIPPPLKFEILEEIEKRIPGFPIVLHGASSVPAELVKTDYANGGNLKMQLVFLKTNYAVLQVQLFAKSTSTLMAVWQ